MIYNLLIWLIIQLLTKPSDYIFTDCGAKADIVFLLDSSGSVGSTDFGKMLKFVQGVADKFTIGPNDIQVGVDTFQSSVKTQFNMNHYKDKNALKAAIGKIAYHGGGTNTGPAIKYMTTDSFSAKAGKYYFVQEKFEHEDTKGILRDNRSAQDGQCNGTKKRQALIKHYRKKKIEQF